MGKSRSARISPLLAATAFAALAGVAFVDAAQATDAAGKVARGKYLVMTSVCNDCHTPWKMGPAIRRRWSCRSRRLRPHRGS